MAGIVSDATAGLSQLVGVHGGTGVMQWKRFGTGNMMFSDVDSYEIAELPPGSRAGRHVHSRTEELFFVLSGRAAIGLGDRTVEVGPGDAILTGFHGIQSVEAIGEEPYRMLVIEALPPQIAAALPGHEPTEEETGMPEPAYHVEHLDSGGAVNTAALGDVFLAAWRTVELVALAPGAALGPRELEDSEAIAYVTGGTGTAHLQHGPVKLREGIALTLFKDERLHLEAGEGGLEVFLAEIGTERP